MALGSLSCNPPPGGWTEFRVGLAAKILCLATSRADKVEGSINTCLMAIGDVCAASLIVLRGRPTGRFFEESRQTIDGLMVDILGETSEFLSSAS